MVIPFDSLEQDTLQAILQEFITREGTDYGAIELTLEQKVEALYTQVRNQHVLIVFDEATESVTLIDAEQYRASEQPL